MSVNSLTIVLCCVVLGCGLVACQRPGAVEKADKDVEVVDVKPLIFILAHPGRARRADTGVAFAAWPDGRVIRSKSSNYVTDSLIKGNLDYEQLGVLRSRLSDFLISAQDGNLIVDGAYQEVYIRQENHLKTRSHSLRPNYESEDITDLIKFLWSMDIPGAIEVDGDFYKRYPEEWM